MSFAWHAFFIGVSMLRQNQHLGQKQLLKLSPQQIQLLNFIQFNALELEQKIHDELEDNPVLEGNTTNSSLNPETERSAETDTRIDDERGGFLEGYQQEDFIPDYRTRAEEKSTPEFPFLGNLVEQNDFRDALRQQLTMLALSERALTLTHYLIDNLDDDGYLRISLEDILDNLAFSQQLYTTEDDLLEQLETLQSLEPTGVGARDLRECLLLQIESKPSQTPYIHCAWKIVNAHLEDLAAHNYDHIKSTLRISSDELKNAIELITKLNPKPVGDNGAQLYKNQNIIPEFLVEQNEAGLFNVSLMKGSTELRLSNAMMDKLEQLRKAKRQGAEKDTHGYLKSKMDAAVWFIEMIKMRENSMLLSMQSIVQLQPEYFQSGDPKQLRPMGLKDISAITGFDVSTISRVTSTKYAQTDFGVVHLKSLFNQEIANADGDLVTNKEIMDALSSIVAEEDKSNPVSDQEIVAKLATKGYVLARRTVAKYREILHVPAAKMRKRQ